MKNFYLPDYYGGSILNLMSSIATALGTKTKYKHLKLLNPSELKGTKNIILLIIDGLGYEYLRKYGKGTVFCKYLRGSMTSVFPSATTSAIPVFLTGTSSQKHGMVSWFSFLKEFGQVIAPLPYTTRIKHKSLKDIVKINEVFNLNPLSNHIKVKSYAILGKEIVNSDFTVTAGGKAKRIGYNNLKGLFRILRKLINLSGKKYIYAYWSEHDTFCHKYGVDSKKTLKSFKELDRELEKFLKSIKNKNTKIIITADHGLVDVPKSKKIKINDHPKLANTLSVPICGDLRYAYCFVKSSKKKEFEKYVKTNLKKYCTLYKSKDFVKKGYFGLEKPSNEFLERIGEYIIIMKDNYAIYQKLVGEKGKYSIGEHGGFSKDEMIVPLILIDSDIK